MNSPETLAFNTAQFQLTALNQIFHHPGIQERPDE